MRSCYQRYADPVKAETLCAGELSIRYTLDSTEPDSIHSFVYSNKTFIDTTAIMKARAFKEGWHGSDVVMFQFYKAKYKADTVILLMRPTDSLYKVQRRQKND